MSRVEETASTAKKIICTPKKRLNPQSWDSGVFICLNVSSNDTSSGGGIRTPDTRIMIRISESLNPLNGNGKQQDEKGVYTSVYTSDSELKFVVDSWNQ